MICQAIREFGMHRHLVWVGLAIVLAGDSAALLQAQEGGQSSGRGGRRRSFDPASYLQRLDANGNGSLEPSELSDRSRSFVEGLGFNPDETNSIEKIKAKISGDQASSGRSGGSSEKSSTSLGSPERTIVRKVPGFDTATPEKKSVPNFTSSSQPSSGELDGKYGSEIMEQVSAAMGRYDKNGDGKIDQAEMSEGRWGQPDPKESDTNGDGNLSKSEMAERYYRRTSGTSSGDSSSSRGTSGDRGSSEERGRDSGSRSSRRGFNRDESPRNESPRNERPRNESPREESRESASSSESRESPSRSSGGGDRYRKYADGLMEQYDTDKDGNLNKEEVAAMKQKPENADLDGNGMISAGELTEAIANGSMGGGGSSGNRGTSSGGSSGSSSRERSSASGSRSSDSGSNSESGRGSSSRSSGSKFSFLASDKNRDGNVQMHEFTDEWTDEKFEEFKTYDKNGDGIITNAEYRGSDSSRRR